MQLETALFFEPVEQIYARVFRFLRPGTPLPRIGVHFRQYANANSRIRLEEGKLKVDLSDLLEHAPAPVHEALASILICKLFRMSPEAGILARYRRYLNRADVRHSLHRLRQERGRKTVLDPLGKFYDLRAIFEELNLKYFYGLMARPRLGWSTRVSRTTLGHYDPSHHTIVLTSLFDSANTPDMAIKYVMFHEMLHLKFPTQHRGARRCVHTPEFKRAEAEFENFKEAKQALRNYLETKDKPGGERK